MSADDDDRYDTYVTLVNILGDADLASSRLQQLDVEGDPTSFLRQLRRVRSRTRTCGLATE